MKLSVSNIGWTKENDRAMYAYLSNLGFAGLEIAPTRLFPEEPYKKVREAVLFSRALREEFGMVISSIQSIWYGKKESIFGSAADRAVLLDYTKSAIDWAQAIGCSNLVFGCPRNRNMPEGGDIGIAADFFRSVGAYASNACIVLALEPNPPIYQTNFLNTTAETIRYVNALDNAGIALNLDTGAMIHEGATPSVVEAHLPSVHHVHFSEPYLKPLEHRCLHTSLLELFRKSQYQGFVSIEMGTCEQAVMLNACHYLAKLAESLSGGDCHAI